jgi:hypothetical protein
MKKIVVLLLLFVLTISWAEKLELPKIHAGFMLDGKLYSGDTANSGDYNSTDRFQIRKAAITLAGKVPRNVAYFVELGLSTCSGSGSDLKLMNAGLLLNLSENFHLGIAQDHVLRSFAATTECTTRLTLEKPNYLKTFGTCHPLGLIAGGYTELPAEIGLEYELALCNGVNGTLDGEHDFVLGAKLATPVAGLGLTASYNHTAANYFDATFKEYSEDGYRYNVGVNYENKGIWFTSEFSKGEGFTTDDQKMEAWYAQLGYLVKLKSGPFSGIQPYVMYENWDKDVAGKAKYAYLNTGVNLKISPYSQLKLSYSKELEQPDGIAEAADSIVLRLQTGF